MSVNLLIAGVAKETGALLKDYLKERGVYDRNAAATVCYGINRSGQPHTLNANCGGGSKIRNMLLMEAAGAKVVPWFEGNNIPRGFKFPALARQIQGHGGLDIVPVFQADEIPWRVASGWSWFSSYVPVETEFRVWIFRGEHLDTYEKVMQRPADYKYVGRNFRNGFDFIHRPKQHAEATKQAILAVKALKLDFSAVDLLLGKDGEVYILEANTAPGVIKSGAQATLGKLADKIVEWDNGGHK